MRRTFIVIVVFAALAAAMALLGTGTVATAREASSPQPVDVTVERLSIQNLNHEDTDRVYYSDRFYLAMTWDATASGNGLHAGDHFDMTLPDQMMFPSDSGARDFDLYGEDGRTVVARAHVEPGASGGGTVRVTFTDWVEGRRNVRGSIYLASRFDTTKLTLDRPNTLQTTVAGQVFPITVDVAGPRDIQNEVLAKWGGPDSDSPQAHWTVRINHQRQNLTAARITDSLSGGDGTETYVPDSFVLRQVEMDARGYVTRVVRTVDLAGRLSIAQDGRSYALELGDLNGDSYQLNYRTTYVPGTALRNEASLYSTERGETRSSTVHSADSGGRGQGDLGGRIRVVKTASDDGSLRLAGAVFEVRGPDGSTFDLTTGADGAAVSGNFAPGTYTVREKSAPEGYAASDEVHEVQVRGEGAETSLTVANDPVRVSVPVTKVWKGASAGPVTVRLMADGDETGKTLTLDEAGGWKGSFDGLRRMAPDGHEIVYTVVEDPVDGYDSQVTGDLAQGFTVTNTAREVPRGGPDKPRDPGADQPGRPTGPDPADPGRQQGAAVRGAALSRAAAPAPLSMALVPATGDEEYGYLLVIACLALTGASVWLTRNL